MRVLVISQYFPPDGGGGSTRVSNALLSLRRRGHQVEVVAAFPHYPHGIVPRSCRGRAFTRNRWMGMRIVRVWVPGIPHAGLVRRLFMYGSFAFSALIGLPFVRSADVIWAANPNVFSSFPAILYGLFKRAPIVRNVDDLWPETAIEEGYLGGGLASGIGRLLAKAAYKLCSALTPISGAYCREIVRHYGIPRRKIHVVEVGVDTDLFNPSDSVRPSKKGREHILTVMYSGVLGTGYNFDLLLQVAKRLKADKRIRFVIRGFGEREKEIRTTASKAGLSNIVLRTEFLPPAEFVTQLASADILILPMTAMKAHEAGIPTKLFEYMACGKPIVCCSDGEAANLVRRAKCGITVSPDNSEAAANAILTLTVDRTLRESMGRNGRDYVLRHLSIDQIGRKLERVFESAAKIETHQCSP